MTENIKQNNISENILETENPYADSKALKLRAGQWYNRVGGALSIHFAMTIFLNLISSVILMFIGSACGIPKADLIKAAEHGWLLITSLLISYVVSNTVSSVIGLSFIGKLKGSFKAMFARPQMKTSHILLAVFGAMSIQSVSLIIQALLSQASGSSGMENMTMPEFSETDTFNNIMFIAYIAILGPISEEIIFRGMAMKGFNFASRNFAIFFSSFTFAMFHGNIMQGIIAFLLGIFLVYLDMKAGSIIPSVILHITNNSIGCIMSIIECKYGEDVSDKFSTIYVAASIIIGTVCLAVLLRSLKKQPLSDREYFTPEIDLPKDEKKKYCLPAALKAPCIWVFTAIYTIFIIINF